MRHWSEHNGERTKWAHIFGAICPAEGKGAGLAMPWCDTEATRYDKTVLSFESFLNLAAARLCLKSFVNTA